MNGLKNDVLKEIWSKLKLAKPRPSTKDPLATGIANFAMENCPHGCVSKKKTSTDSEESETEVDEVGDMDLDLNLDVAGVKRVNYFDKLSDDDTVLSQEIPMQVSKRRKINDAKDKNVTESGSDKRIPRNRRRPPKSGKDLDDGKLFYD